MSGFSFFNFITLIFLGIAGAIGGYILRRLEKFEETSDNFRALSLTQISASAKLIVETINFFKSQYITKDDMATIFDSIESNIKKQIFDMDGVALLDDEKREHITQFYFTFVMFSKAVKNFTNEANLRTKFSQNKQKIGKTSLEDFEKEINQVQADLKNELKSYRRVPLWMILLISLLAAASAMITYLESIINS